MAAYPHFVLHTGDISGILYSTRRVLEVAAVYPDEMEGPDRTCLVSARLIG